MSRVILVSNRVTDLRKAAQAGGVAVALAHVMRTHPSLWFGWSGDVKPVVHAEFPLERAADAHRELEAGRVIGKLVLRT